MCFCASANFAGSAVLGGIGVATLTEVKHSREILFAAVPTLFALHQFTEGFVWLGMDGILPASVARGAGAAYVLYAQGLLPFLLPLSVLLIEPTPEKQRRMFGFVMLGAALSVYILWGLIAAPLQITVRDRSIDYENVFTSSAAVGVLYVMATCGALLFSGFRYLMILGVLNIIGLLIVMATKMYAFTSLWCAYAAAVSVIIYFFFRRTRADRPSDYSLPLFKWVGTRGLRPSELKLRFRLKFRATPQ